MHGWYVHRANAAGSVKPSCRQSGTASYPKRETSVGFIEGMVQFNEGIVLLQKKTNCDAVQSCWN
jgi:hypothetical protein